MTDSKKSTFPDHVSRWSDGSDKFLSFVFLCTLLAIRSFEHIAKATDDSFPSSNSAKLRGLLMESLLFLYIRENVIEEDLPDIIYT